MRLAGVDAQTDSTSSMAPVNPDDDWQDTDSSGNSISSGLPSTTLLQRRQQRADSIADADTAPLASEAKEEPQRVCTACAKPESSLSIPLKRCAKCHTGLYCSRDCQKADWKSHKKTCAVTGGPSIASNTTSNPQAPASGPAQSPNLFSALASGKYLHLLSEKDTFTALIDSYRLRVEDEYTFTGEISTRSLYGGANPLPDFRRYLNLAEKRPGLLPPWWTNEKRNSCEKVAVDKSQWSDLNCAVEKSDIVEHYGDGMMPMKLRMLAEEVYKKGISAF